MMAGRDLSAELFDAQSESQNQSWIDEVKGGIASAPIDLYLGAKQLIGDLTPEERLVLKYNREAAAKAPIASAIGGMATYAPLSMVPGANTIIGGMAAGGVTGALQPVEEGEDRLINSGIGALLGGLVPMATRGGGGLKGLVIDPRTQKGQSKIVGKVLSRQSGDIGTAVAKATERTGSTSGFSPTLGQSSGDPGIAALERTLRASMPEAFAARDAAQRTALAGAVNTIAGDDATMKALIGLRRQYGNEMYSKAINKTPEIPDNETASKIGELLKRPSINKASKEAQRRAMERGETPAAEGSLRALHDVKTKLDDYIGTAKIKSPSEVGELMGTKQILGEVMDKLSPAYREANDAYAYMSRPINQMQIGTELRNRLVPSLYRDMDTPAQLNAASFSRALTDQGDDIARQATGMSGSTIESVLSQEQLKTLKGVQSDLQMMKILENAGRGAGSDTMQKLSKSAAMADAGVPDWIGGAMHIGNQGLPGRIANAITHGNDDAIRARMVESLLNPAEAAEAVRIANQPKGLLGTYAPRVLQGGMLGMTPFVLQ